MGGENPAGRKDDHHTGEHLLKAIADKERALEAQVAAARDDAAAIVARARAEAEQIARDARTEVARLTGESERQVADAAARIHGEAQAGAEREVENLRAQAAGRLDAAVAGVVERVVTGRE